MFILTATLGFVALAAVNAAGYYFKLNKNLISAASILVIMVSVWFSLKASREEVLRERAHQSSIELAPSQKLEPLG
jgi:hypothetical protein